MLLVLDVGNTNLVIGLFRGEELAVSFRLTTDRSRTVDEYFILLKSLLHNEGYDVADLEGVAISNVVPALGGLLEEMCSRHFKRPAFFATADKKLGIKLAIDHPHQLGADLLVAAEEGFARHGGPLVVIDMGTATTISAIDAEGRFLGTTIAPGLAVSVEAIYQRAPHLPRIALERPPRPWGTNTVHSLQAGILVGHACMVEGIVGRMRAELGAATRVVATGGLAEVLARECPSIEAVEPWLVLQGVRRVYEASARAVAP